MPNGSRLRLSRDLGKIIMDVNGGEQVNVAALGGADALSVNDLSGTDVNGVNIDLAGTPGSSADDGQAQNVIVNGTKGNDAIVVAGSASGVAVLGLPAQVNITGAEPANDRLAVNALAGDDVIDATGLSTDAIGVTENGGNGNDTLNGGDSVDVDFPAASSSRTVTRWPCPSA
jgi:hypothetical protein